MIGAAPALVAAPLVLLLSLLWAAEAAVPHEPAYRVGPGDVLEVTVAGRPDLSRLPTVQTTGTIWMPRLLEVRVEGLTPAEIAAKLAELLRARQEDAAPMVTVRVREYQSQFVWVAGEVNQPGRKALKGRTRLIDVLLEAGGFTARASGEVLVERRSGHFADGSAVRRFRFPQAGPTAAGLAELETVLESGDVVTASVGQYVTVTGDVVRPGRYSLEKDTTVTALVSSAGGLRRLGSRRVKVSRRDPASGRVHVLQADLDAIEKGREPDLMLLPDDQVEVKGRLL
jgi:polysaccharide export outer membrane protein